MKFCKNPVSAGFFILNALLSFGFLSGCHWRSDVGNKPVLQVNEHKITAKEFADRLARQLKDFDALSAKDANIVKRAKEEILRNYILENIVIDFASTQKISVTDEDLEKDINDVRASYPDDISFRRMLAEDNLSLQSWKEQRRMSLLYKIVFKKIGENLVPPTAVEIQKYYEENKDRYKHKERIYMRQIVTDDLSKAQSLKEELKKKDFAELAKKYSVSPEAKAGGLVGWVERGAVDIFDKAFTLPANGTSQVLESVYGFHIFKVEKKESAGFYSLEQVKKEVTQALMARKEQAEFSSWLDKQIRSSRVLRDNDLLAAIIVETK